MCTYICPCSKTKNFLKGRHASCSTQAKQASMTSWSLPVTAGKESACVHVCSDAATCDDSCAGTFDPFRDWAVLSVGHEGQGGEGHRHHAGLRQVRHDKVSGSTSSRIPGPGAFKCACMHYSAYRVVHAHMYANTLCPGICNFLSLLHCTGLCCPSFGSFLFLRGGGGLELQNALRTNQH